MPPKVKSSTSRIHDSQKNTKKLKEVVLTEIIFHIKFVEQNGNILLNLIKIKLTNKNKNNTFTFLL